MFDCLNRGQMHRLRQIFLKHPLNPSPLSHSLPFTMSSSTSPLPPQDVVKKRWLGFLIWQSIAAAAVHIPSSLLLGPSSSSFPAALLFYFLAFHLSLLLLSLALFLLASPHPDPSASLPDLAAAALRASLKSLVGGFSRPSFTADFARRARRALASATFLMICGSAGCLSAVAVCGVPEVVDGTSLVGVGLRGMVFGLVYGLHYVYRKRWILKFPIIQRPLFYSFKIGLHSSFKLALKLSVQAYVCSVIVMLLLPNQFKNKSTTGKFIIQQIKFYIGTVNAAICWEISHHLLQVVHTRRCIFAPPQGSAAAETNPSETLLETLEQSNPRSLVQYLAYLDLCIVSESNVEPWRRAAFFEETGETYQRVINVCLKPLEQLTSRLAEGLEGFSMDKTDFLSKQLNSPVDIRVDSKLREAFNDFQISSWCARALGALTARSHLEDRYGVAQLTGCNKAVVSTLLSCLLAVEACLGKKTSPQPAHSLGPSSIRWATINTGKRDGVSAVASKRRGVILYAKAYAMADVLKTSVYQIVSSFETDMQANAKASVLEKKWIGEGKPLYGTCEILIQKLCLFLDYQVV